MKMKRYIPIASAVVTALVIFLSPVAGFAITGKEISQNVHDRDNGDSSAAETTLTLINNKGQTKERTIRTVRKEYGELSKSMIRFLAPADVKGTGFLVWENADRDDDQFLYLPALKQDPRRIASSEKSSRFMGTEVTYEDLQNRKVENDTHTLLREETYDGSAVYVVESVPKEGTESQYGKFISWIRYDIWMPVKIEFYDKNGELLKIMRVSALEEIQGIWTAAESEMENVQENRKTIMTINKIQYNISIPDDYFTERYLKE
jgi:outer membrane lipoprotein-sorting protein